MAKGALDKKQEEQSRLARQYRIAKRTELEALCQTPVCGEKLRKFVATLNHFGAGDADKFVDYVRRECSKWADEAPEDIRFAMLQAIDARVMAIRMRAGMPEFDDPLMNEQDDVFQLCKRVLGL